MGSFLHINQVIWQEAFMKKIGILLFILALMIGVIFANLFSFGKVDASGLFNFSFVRGVKGSGNIVKEKRDITGFNSVSVSGVFNIEIVSGRDFSVEVEADDNLLPIITTEVNNGVLKISSEGRIRSINKMLVRISAPDIEKVRSSGVAKVSVEEIKNSSFELSTSGASKVSLSGSTAELKIDVSGAGKVEAENLSAQNASVRTSGAGKINVNVSESLDAKVSGAGTIRYSGSPKNVNERKSGAGKIMPL